jgi:hypothetical protein
VEKGLRVEKGRILGPLIAGLHQVEALIAMKYILRVLVPHICVSSDGRSRYRGLLCSLLSQLRISTLLRAIFSSSRDRKHIQ